MRKNYIIKDARRILAEQIRDNGMNTMNKNPITNDMYPKFWTHIYELG